MPTIIGPKFLFAPPDAGGVPLLAMPTSSIDYATFQDQVRRGMSIPSNYGEVCQRLFPGYEVERAIVETVEVGWEGRRAEQETTKEEERYSQVLGG